MASRITPRSGVGRPVFGPKPKAAAASSENCAPGVIEKVMVCLPGSGARAVRSIRPGRGREHGSRAAGVDDAGEAAAEALALGRRELGDDLVQLGGHLAVEGGRPAPSRSRYRPPPGPPGPRPHGP